MYMSLMGHEMSFHIYVSTQLRRKTQMNVRLNKTAFTFP